MNIFAEEASHELWGIVSSYIERHGAAGPDQLALGLLVSGLELADREHSRGFCEDELPLQGDDPISTSTLSATERRLRTDGQPLSQEDIIRELIETYRDDPEIVARLEEFIKKYL